MQWYAVQVTPNHEQKVKRYLGIKKIDGLANVLGDVIIPAKDGKNVMPGYIFVQSEVWPQFFLPGKCKTLGTVTQDELNRLIIKTATILPPLKPPSFKKGDHVMIHAGPFGGVIGVVEKAAVKRSRVSLFDREVLIDADNRALQPVEQCLPEHPSGQV